jgi:hypothetical protein
MGHPESQNQKPGAEAPFIPRFFAGLPFDFAQGKKAHASTIENQR